MNTLNNTTTQGGSKEGRPASTGEKIAMLLIVAIVTYLFIKG